MAESPDSRRSPPRSENRIGQPPELTLTRSAVDDVREPVRCRQITVLFAHGPTAASPERIDLCVARFPTGNKCGGSAVKNRRVVGCDTLTARPDRLSSTPLELLPLRRLSVAAYRRLLSAFLRNSAQLPPKRPVVSRPWHEPCITVLAIALLASSRTGPQLGGPPTSRFAGGTVVVDQFVRLQSILSRC